MFCFSNNWLLYPSSSDTLFSDYKFLILFSYSLIIFWCSANAFYKLCAPPWIIWELKAFIFSYNFFFSSRYLKNYFDLCCKAKRTLFLSSSIFFFSYYSCSNWTSLVLSMSTLFFYSNSVLNFFSSFSYLRIKAFWSRSSLIAGLFLILLARWANFNDDKDSWNA